MIKKISNIMNNKMVKIVSKTIKLLLTIFVILLASVIFVQRISNNRVSLGGFKIFTIVSESMVPKYNLGDMLLSKNVAPSELKVGDDLVYKGEVDDFKDKIVTHQIIKIRQKSDGTYEYTTKGIANPEEDPTVKDTQIYGKVIYKSIALSFCSKLVNSTYGFYFVIFVPMVILIFIEVLQEINYKENNKKKAESKE